MYKSFSSIFLITLSFLLSSAKSTFPSSFFSFSFLNFSAFFVFFNLPFLVYLVLFIYSPPLVDSLYLPFLSNLVIFWEIVLNLLYPVYYYIFRSSEEHEASRRLKNEFLVLIEGVATQNYWVYVIGATNSISDLDSAALRRFVSKFKIFKTKRIFIPNPESS